MPAEVFRGIGLIELASAHPIPELLRPSVHGRNLTAQFTDSQALFQSKFLIVSLRVNSLRHTINPCRHMKANVLLKQNINTLLTRRNQSRRDLARWCHRTESWLSQIFTKPEREIPLKYLDRMADFFGVAVYQLFQPGISSISERRKGLDRRSGKDRRLSAMGHHVRESVSSTIANLSPADVADLIRWKTLTDDSRAAVREAMQAVERSERQGERRGRARRAAETVGEAATPPVGRPSHHQKPPKAGTGG
jgi:hypothetical protein